MKTSFLFALAIAALALTGCGDLGNAETTGPNQSAAEANKKMVDDAAKSGKRTAVADIQEEVAK